MPLILAAVAALAHTITTARAAPTLLGQRDAVGDEVRLAKVFTRLERWQTARALLQVATFGLMLWAIAAALGS